MQYTLKQLTVFKAVVGLQSTTAAAQTLALSQSAVSSAIQQLELQIGQKFLTVLEGSWCSIGWVYL